MSKFFLISRFTVLTVILFACAAKAEHTDFAIALSAAAIDRTTKNVVYDPAYVSLNYPMGDVAPTRGVCADVIIRALRALDIDLQAEVHEDMRRAFNAYPMHWGLSRPDSNIDHRRVPNLETYFSRLGAKLPTSTDANFFQPGDIVAWNLKGKTGGWMPHIGIVTDRRAPSGRRMVAHNIGAGPVLSDVIFDWPITGHYRLRRELFSP